MTVREQLHKVDKMPDRGRDQPAIYDSLERKEFAEGLAALFLNPYVKSPLTVGIFGDWGMGKSSLMIQTEHILLKTAAQLAFPTLLETEQFPGCRQIKTSPKGQQKYEEINIAAKNLPSSDSKDDPLLKFLDGDYQEEYHEVYKSLALIDRSEMFEMEDEEKADSSGKKYALRKIPSILTIRYNAWHYQDESEAWAGMAVEITKAIEESMTTAQRVRCHCRYAWRKQRSRILFEFFLPCLFALFLSAWVALVLWKLISTSKNNELAKLTYGSIPITILVVGWTVARQLFSVIKPISAQIKGYFSVPDHTTKLGYQHQVIFDIKFLIEDIGKKPSWIWRFIGSLCNLCHLYPDYSQTVNGTSISKSPAPGKDDIRMIVFVDDLDRCQDTVILKVLSAAHLVLAACDINVILGMDEKMIARAMKYQFPDNNPEKWEEFGKKYISKIVQLPLVIPDTSEDETMKFLHEQLGPAFTVTKRDNARSENPGQPRTEDGTPDNQFPPDGCCDHVCLEVVTETPQFFGRNLSHMFNQFWRFKDWLRGLLQCIPSGQKETQRKLKTMLSIQMIITNYSDAERQALDALSKAATGERKLPREWKRFLTYHRVAWNVLSRNDQVKKTPGWQMQLVVWVFCCWQWEHQINDIIRDWKKLVPVNGFSKDGDDWPSLNNIIEHYLQPQKDEEQKEKQKRQPNKRNKKQKLNAKQGKDEEEQKLDPQEEAEEKEKQRMQSNKRTKKRKLNAKESRVEEEQELDALKRKQEEQDALQRKQEQELDVLKRKQEEQDALQRKQEQELDALQRKQEEQEQELLCLKRRQEEQEHELNTQKRKDKKEDEEKEKKKKAGWYSLKSTLDTNQYDVSLDCILAFQKFRLHCDIGHLSSPKNNGNTVEKASSHDMPHP